MSTNLSFALNHMAAPRLDLAAFFSLARKLGVRHVEIRNDLPANAIADGTSADAVARLAREYGVEIITINALQRFNDWNEARLADARALAAYARDCGARAVVLCPVNDPAYRPDARTRALKLRESLKALSEIFGTAGVDGLVEPLGFEECSLRTKSEAVKAIVELGISDRFKLVHDTFHHYLSCESESFPANTGLVHISGVEDARLPTSAIRDGHRLLVGPADIMGNVAQLKTLLEGGYSGPASFEPFAPVVHDLDDAEGALRQSMSFIVGSL